MMVEQARRMSRRWLRIEEHGINGKKQSTGGGASGGRMKGSFAVPHGSPVPMSKHSLDFRNRGQGNLGRIVTADIEADRIVEPTQLRRGHAGAVVMKTTKQKIPPLLRSEQADVGDGSLSEEMPHESNVMLEIVCHDQHRRLVIAGNCLPQFFRPCEKYLCCCRETALVGIGGAMIDDRQFPSEFIGDARHREGVQASTDDDKMNRGSDQFQKGLDNAIGKFEFLCK